MFRGCCFEYAGVYSGDYNLALMYVDNSYNTFDSGGKYEPSTDTLPSSAESLLYGLNRSEKPLEFSIEIINPDSAIPFEQMTKIKNWLFGQDGWKTFRIMDKDYGNYHLKCLLIPDEDITDISGYRGLRCTLKNISPFWYGDKIDINFDSESLIANKDTLDDQGYLSLNVPIENCPEYIKIYPTISFDYQDGGSAYFKLYNDTNGSAVQSVDNFKSLNTTFNTKYLVNDMRPVDGHNILYLSNGNNILRLYCKDKFDHIVQYTSLSFSYEPLYRIGGF